MIDLAPLWDFDDAEGSERRFRDAAADATGADRLVLLSQVARALGLQERFAEAHDTLDQVLAEPPTVDGATMVAEARTVADPDEAPGVDAEVSTRVALERGRLFRSAGRPDEARPLFEAAVAEASRAGMDELLVDALHMVALVVPADEQRELLDQALEVARASPDPAARRWEASLLNNLGMTHADAGEWPTALAVFEQALAARRLTGRVGDVRIARWMVAWALRNLGRTGEALAIQRELKAELLAAEQADPYVDEELQLLAGGPDSPTPVPPS
ncbi:MAG TPA: tetratricopeptide repeat protein [Propionicimonas sp.]|jgi:tetratricopeptide (TPR) repeat protein